MADTNGRAGLRGPEENAPRLREDHEDRARKRMAEIRANLGDEASEPEFVDKWFAAAPPGWSYEWKTHTVWNKEFPQYMNSLLRTGWSPVPAARHRDLVFPGYTDEDIIIDGMILMERPKELTDRVRAREKSKAVDQVRNSEAKLVEAPNGTAPRTHREVRPVITSSVGPAVIPE